ncbi:MAG: InlB B-repeat-containing protein, partial [Firmicutes bacterium]|nr:InlB B-repeat-containing protein [Bacillota bacterium]
MSKLYRTPSWRRVLALALVFIMTLSILGTSGYTVFAEDLFGDGEQPVAEEVVTTEPEEADTEQVPEAVESEEAAPPEEEAAEPAEEAGEGEEPAGVPEEAEAAEGEQEEAEEPAEPADAEVPAEEPAGKPGEEGEPAEPAEGEEPAEQEEPAEEGETIVETAVDIVANDDGAEAPDAEPAEGEEPAEEPTEPAQGEEPAEEPAQIEEPAEEPAEGSLIADILKQLEEGDIEEGLAEGEELPEEEIPEELVAMPEMHFRDIIDGISVTVDAPEGAFPEGTEMKLAEVEIEQIIEAVEAAVEGEITKIKAVDITFVYEGDEIQPLLPINVKMNAAGMNADSERQVLHIEEDEETEEMVATVIEDADTSKKAVTFEADSFSVYVVVETGDDARLLVKFVRPDGTENGVEIESMYIKAGDNMTQVLYDPGLGSGYSLPSDVTFKGWTTVKNYTIDTTPLTIVGVRSEVAGMLPPEEDETTVTYYAMLFKSYTVTYYDENNISLGKEEVEFRADSTEASQPYTVNMAYTVTDNEHNFAGWLVLRGSSGIDGYSAGKSYQNGNQISISNNVDFGVDNPAGHWLVFDENGKGGTYNAPQFIESGDITARPRPDSEMERFGYTFGGWYTDAACTDGNEFVFGNEITDYTIIYAKWISNTIADYSIIIWKQNAAGDDYDFYKSVLIKDAQVGSTPNAVTTAGTGNNRYATVDGIAYSAASNNTDIKEAFTGFHFDNTDQASKTVATEGNTVVNVYYNRNEITFNFYTYAEVYTPTTNNSGTQYGIRDGEYVELYHVGNAWYFVWTVDRYRGTRYLRSSEWTIYQTMNGLYGSTLADHNYTWPTEYDWYSGHSDNSGDVSGTRTTFLDAFLPASSATTVNFYGSDTEGTKHIYFYKQNPDKNGYTLANTVNTDATGFNLSDKYSGFECVAWNSTNNTSNWITVGELMNQDGNFYYDANPNQDGYQTASINSSTGLHIYFNRESFTLSFLNGSYYDTDGDVPTLEETASPTTFKTVEDITYGADLSAYNKGGGSYYEPPAVAGYEGYVFDGWYLDDICTQPCTFTTLPDGGLTVYAKWVLIQYRVILHPNYPDGAVGDIDWGNNNQKMTFRISYGGKVSAPTGRFNDGRFVFVGWYKDEACTQAFNADAFVLNDTNVTAVYNKNSDYTDSYDVNGNLTNPSNSDLTGYNGEDRFWITRKLEIYGKWRATLSGASGIGLVYEVGEGSNPPSDPNTYVDNAPATAGAAATPPNSTLKFGYWVMQKWNGTEFVDVAGSQIFPGDPFTVLASNAKVEDLANPTPGGDTKKYTVQLRAEYVPTEQPTPTAMYWYPNGGTGNLIVDEPLGINQAVDIRPANTFSRPGYTFVGWARVAAPLNADGTVNTGAFTQNNNLAAWIVWDGEAFTCADAVRTANPSGIVTQVAADEDNPYHAMYAVWEENEVTINYAVASDSTGFGTVSPTTETVNAATDTAQGSTATAADNYIFDHWSVDDTEEGEGEFISDDAAFVPEKNNGVYEAHTYYAHFILNKAEYTIHHYINGTEIKVADDQTGTGVIGETVISATAYSAGAEALYDAYKTVIHKRYDPTENSVTITEDPAHNVINVYYVIPITIKAASQEWTYDGETHSNSNVTVTSGSLMTDDSLVATATGSVTNVADTANNNNPIAEGYKIMNGDTDVSGRYQITAQAGKLTIKPKAVTVTAQSHEFTYTGAAQSWPEYDVEGLVGDDAITATVTGSITLPSESPVTNTLASYEFTTGTPGNYTVTTAN